MRRCLNKKDLATIISLSERLNAIRNKYDEEQGTDVELRIKSNGTVGSNLDCALASLEVILQEY